MLLVYPSFNYLAKFKFFGAIGFTAPIPILMLTLNDKLPDFCMRLPIRSLGFIIGSFLLVLDFGLVAAFCAPLVFPQRYMAKNQQLDVVKYGLVERMVLQHVIIWIGVVIYAINYFIATTGCQEAIWGGANLYFTAPFTWIADVALYVLKLYGRASFRFKDEGTFKTVNMTNYSANITLTSKQSAVISPQDC
jgi:hypothetical protein